MPNKFRGIKILPDRGNPSFTSPTLNIGLHIFIHPSRVLTTNLTILKDIITNVMVGVIFVFFKHCPVLLIYSSFYTYTNSQTRNYCVQAIQKFVQYKDRNCATQRSNKWLNHYADKDHNKVIACPSKAPVSRRFQLVSLVAVKITSLTKVFLIKAHKVLIFSNILS